MKSRRISLESWGIFCYTTTTVPCRIHNPSGPPTFQKLHLALFMKKAWFHSYLNVFYDPLTYSSTLDELLYTILTTVVGLSFSWCLSCWYQRPISYGCRYATRLSTGYWACTMQSNLSTCTMCKICCPFYQSKDIVRCTGSTDCIVRTKYKPHWTSAFDCSYIIVGSPSHICLTWIKSKVWLVCGGPDHSFLSGTPQCPSCLSSPLPKPCGSVALHWL